MTDAVRVSDHLEAFVGLLNDAQLQDSWSPAPAVFGRGRPPDSYGWSGAPGQSPFQAYGIVWRIGARDARNANLDDVRGTEGRVLLFVRYFGGFPDQADELRDLGHETIMDGPLVVPGRHVLWVSHDNGSTSTKSDDVETPYWEAGDFYRLRTRPA